MLLGYSRGSELTFVLARRLPSRRSIYSRAMLTQFGFIQCVHRKLSCRRRKTQSIDAAKAKDHAPTVAVSL